jgi:hypothetical protein
MNSAISTDVTQAKHSAREGDPGLRPWQFFLLAGMLAATGVVLVSAGQSPASIIVLSLTVVSASFVALGAYRALAPLVNAEGAEAPQLIVGHTRAALEREKALVLRAIKDLEFDYAMKKVAKNDFDEMSTRLRSRALGLMRQLDSGGGYREAIERELAARVGGSTSAPVGATVDKPTSAPVGATVDKPLPGPRLCVCGTPNDPDARFCKQCGAALHAA